MMRRPLKPFVTEYKGGRRASAPFGETPSFESERPPPKPIEGRAPSEPDSDDSYEAAMRAADALFSSPPDRKTEAGSDLLLAGAHIGGISPDRAGGRILRVIDEVPSPQFAALEAELAPKRRGRKPGSKNKPKVSALAATPDGPELVPLETAQASQSPAAIDAGAFRSSMPLRGRVAALTTVATAAPSEKRFPWVRDRLKPGENWKRRRLPKVCW